MPTITLSIPEETRKKMKKFEWLNWSAVAREAFEKRMRQLEILDKFEKDFSESELTDKECMELGKEIKKRMAEKE